MNERQKTVLMWIIALAVLFLGIWICCGRNHGLWDWHGAGACDLLAKEPTLKNGRKIFTAPLSPVIIPPKYKVTFYFAATSVADNLLESDFSDEVSLGYTNGMKKVDLAWDHPPGTNVIIDYRIYRGFTSSVYSAVFHAGTNLSFTIPLVRTNTNLVIRVTAINATDIAESTSTRGPWFRLYRTNWSATNPPGMKFFKSVGQNSRVGITNEWL